MDKKEELPKIDNPALPPIEPTPQPSPTKNKKPLLITGLIITVVLLAFGATFLLLKSQKTQRNQEVSIPTTPSVTQPPQVYRSKNLVLKRKTDQGWDTLYTFPESGDQRIIRWNDMLFYGNSGYGSKVELFSHDLQTGVTETVFEKETTRQYISDLQVIDKTLFFSIGGYLAGGATYWLNLPPSGTPKQLTESSNGKIEKMNNRYWIIGGEGDACWGVTNYSLIDLNTKIVTPVATSTSGCYEGEEYIDIDKRDRMLLSFHTPDFGGSDGKPDEGIYQYVIAVPLSNPKAKAGVISKQDMPVGITDIKYFENKDSLILSGKGLYVFDFETNKLSKILDITDSWFRSKIDSWTNNSICLSKLNNDKTEVAEINTDTKQLNENASNCQIKPSPTPQSYQQTQDEGNQKLIKSLNLPSNYELVLE